MGGDTKNEKEHPHDQKISFLLIEDIFLQSMSKSDFQNIEGETSIEFIIHPSKTDGEKMIKHKIVNKNMSIRELKSLILFLTD